MQALGSHVSENLGSSGRRSRCARRPLPHCHHRRRRRLRDRGRRLVRRGDGRAGAAQRHFPPRGLRADGREGDALQHRLVRDPVRGAVDAVSDPTAPTAPSAPARSRGRARPRARSTGSPPRGGTRRITPVRGRTTSGRSSRPSTSRACRCRDRSRAPSLPLPSWTLRRFYSFWRPVPARRSPRGAHGAGPLPMIRPLAPLPRHRGAHRHVRR
jgi:hypothetical protein